MNNILLLLLSLSALPMLSQNNGSPSNTMNMKLNAGLITEKIQETKTFYTEELGFGITFESDFYLLLHTPDHSAELSFLQADHPSQQPVFQRPYAGHGMYLTIEVEDVDALCRQLIDRGVEIHFGLRDEPWGDRHFAILDPNGLGIDLVTYSEPQDGDG